MTDSRESSRSAIANPARARQESDACHQEKFDRDSPSSSIISQLGVDASHAWGCASRGCEARLGRRSIALDARATIRGETQK